jgi:hypothetical protein
MIKELHKIFNGLNRYSFPFKDKEKEIPENGIYIIFEKGELLEWELIRAISNYVLDLTNTS